MYPTYNYPLNLNCYASFRTIYSSRKQELKFEVVEGRMAADAFIAFGNDYGDIEKYYFCLHFWHERLTVQVVVLQQL